MKDQSQARYGEALRMIDASQKRALRKLGVYNPQGNHYPYPEPGTFGSEAHKRVIAHYKASRTRAYNRFRADTKMTFPAGF